MQYKNVKPMSKGDTPRSKGLNFQGHTKWSELQGIFVSNVPESRDGRIRIWTFWRSRWRFSHLDFDEGRVSKIHISTSSEGRDDGNPHLDMSLNQQVILPS